MTFHSLTGKDPESVVHYGPEAVPILPGTLVAEIVFANQFMWTRDPKWARLYKLSLMPIEETEIGKHMKPELLIPREAVP